MSGSRLEFDEGFQLNRSTLLQASQHKLSLILVLLLAELELLMRVSAPKRLRVRALKLRFEAACARRRASRHHTIASDAAGHHRAMFVFALESAR